MLRPDDIVIISAARTAIGRFQGALKDVPAPTLGATAIRAVVQRAGIEPALIDEVLLGTVVQAGQGQAPARQAALGAGLPVQVGATTVNKVCGSGLKAAMLGAAMLRAGDAQAVIAGGMESMNGGPYLLPQARFGYRLGEGKLIDAVVHDGLWCAAEDQHMGLSAEWVAEAYGISRDEMDALALLSHQRAVAAMDAGLFAPEIVPVDVSSARCDLLALAVDECPRRNTCSAKLAQLPPAFRPDGRVTAGNSSPLADGAAALLLMRREQARAWGLSPLARIVCYGQAAVKPLEIFTAPIYAVGKVLAKAGMALADLDLIEINEAFAAQVLADLRGLGLDTERVNVHGGALALGHPIGASGARILVTLLYALAARRQERGLATVCLGGGEAVAMIIEMEQSPHD